MKCIVFFMLLFSLVSCMSFINQQNTVAMNKSIHQKDAGIEGIKINAGTMLDDYMDCNDDEMFDSKVTDALEAYIAKDTKRFFGLIQNIECLNHNRFFSAKGGVAIIQDDYYLIINGGSNVILDNRTQEEWRGQSSKTPEIAIIDPIRRIISNRITDDYKKKDVILILFCRDRIYILNYHKKSFGYYANDTDAVGRGEPSDIQHSQPR